jgi:hypothetical protein
MISIILNSIIIFFFFIINIIKMELFFKKNEYSRNIDQDALLNQLINSINMR